MRLNSIKLSGFKSFVEPTHFQLPGQLVGVVGPNGCGKSNIIDAVRWVLGESKASELRGESMQDVIFNGSGLRKPAGRASVELAFDNSDGRAGGPWNRFAEIAVKRVLTRDGTSSYYINDQPVRRRDVQDVFLGTGLGPRAYAIIGQGTISRIIESKPEELRLFLEEAAGRLEVQGAPARDREPAQGHAREPDPRRGHPARARPATSRSSSRRPRSPAAIARCSRTSTLKQHQLWFLQASRRGARGGAGQAAVVAAVAALESRSAELRRAEAELEAIRQSHYEANDALHAAQGALGEAALEVSRLEERIRYVADGRERLVAPARRSRERSTRTWLARARPRRAPSATRRGREIAAAEQRGRAGFAAAHRRRTTATVDALEAALREAQATQQRPARASSPACSSRSRSPPPRCAASTSDWPQAEARRDRLVGEEKGLVAIEPGELDAARQRAAAMPKPKHHAADSPRSPTGRRACRRSTRARRRCRTSSTTKLAATPSSSARLGRAAGAAGEGAGRGQAEAVARRATASNRSPACGRGSGSSPAGRPALEAALRERLGALEIGRLDTVRAFAADAPPARLAFFTAPAAPIANVASHPAAPRRPAASRRRGPDRAARRLARRRLHRERLRRSARRALAASPTAKSS